MATIADGRIIYEPESPMNDPPANRNRNTFAIYVLMFGLIAGVILVAVVLSVNSYGNHLAAAEAEVTANAKIYQENARLVMSNVDGLLAAMDDHIISNPDMEPDELHHFLVDLADDIPSLRVVLVVDENGIIITDSRENEAGKGLDVSQREYYSTHMTDAVSDTVYVGEPVQSMVDGAWSMPFSRGIYASDGTFLGVAVASIEPRYFHDIFASVELDDDQTGLLTHEDGTILSILPYDETLISEQIAEPRLVGVPEANSGVFETDLITGESVVAAYEVVDNWPLTLTFFVDEQVAIEGFYDDLLRIGLVGVVFSLFVLGSGYYQIRQTRAISDQAQMLQESNQSLRREIADRQQAEQNLGRANQQLNLLLQSLPVMLYTVQHADVFKPEYVGGSLLDNMGFTPDDLHVNPNFWRNHIHPDDLQKVLGVLETTMRFTTGYNHQYRLRCADDTYIWVMDYMHLVKNPEDGAHLVGFWVDVTEQQRGLEAQRTSEKLRVDLEKEHELHVLRSRFLSMITHEFRNPIAAINMAASNLQRYGDRMDPDMREEKFDVIYQLLDQLNNLVEDTLLTGKLENDQLELELQKADFCTYCSAVVDDFRLANGHTHHIVYDGVEKCLPTLFDQRLMRHALVNILANAVKYSDVETTVTLSLRQAAQGSTITIRDEGIGIPEAAMGRLFDLFYRAENTENFAGTGVGLALTKHIIDLHRGTIEVESKIGVGTTVTIRLPVT